MRIGSRGRALAIIATLVMAWSAAAQQADVTYTYDALGRVIEARYGNGTAAYTYDAAGNRLTSSSTPPPNAVNDAITTAEDSAHTFDPRTNDTDPAGLALTITAETDGAKGTVAILSGGTQLRYTPNANATGTDSFTYTISNGAAPDTATVNVTITPVNDPPNAVNDSLAVAPNTAKSFDPRANDIEVDGNPLTITAATNGAKGTVTRTTTQVTYTATTGAFGADSFTYTISDGVGGTDTATVSVSINQPPNAVNDSRTTNEEAPFTFDPRGNDTDPDGNALTITAKTNGTKGTVTFTSTQVTYTPNANANGSDSFTYTVSDGVPGAALTDTATVSVTITPVNDAPVAVNDSLTVTFQTAKTFNPRANDTDIDSSTLTITAKTNGTKGTVAIVSSGTQLTYTPAADKYGTDSFTYTISDGALTDTATVNVNIPVTVVREANGTVNSPYILTTTFVPPIPPHSSRVEEIKHSTTNEIACTQIFLISTAGPCNNVQPGYFLIGSSGPGIVKP